MKKSNKEGNYVKVKQNTLALSIAWLGIMYGEVFLNTSLKGNVLYIGLTLWTVLGALGMLLLNHFFSWKNPIDQKESLPAIKELGLILISFILLILLQNLLMVFEYKVLKQPLGSANTNTLISIYHHYPYYLFSIVLAAPIMEELVFRKAIFGNLCQFCPPLISALLSSALFSIAHGDGHFLVYAMMGLVLCYCYYKGGKLRTSMEVHILLNAFILLSSNLN